MSKSRSERKREQKLRRAAANSAKTEENIRSVLDIDSHRLKMTVPGGFLEDWLAHNLFLEPFILIYPLTLIALFVVLPFVIWPIINGESFKKTFDNAIGTPAFLGFLTFLTIFAILSILSKYLSRRQKRPRLVIFDLASSLLHYGRQASLNRYLFLA